MVSIWDGFVQAFQLLFSFNPELYQIVGLSLFVSGTATLLATLVGIPLGSTIALKKFPGRRLLHALTYTLIGLPSVTAGLFIYIIFAGMGPLGFLHLLYTPAAIIVAQFFLALPVITGIVISSVSIVPKGIQESARSLGATDWQITTAILKESRNGIIAGIITGFCTCITEVGAASIVGGNIRYETRVLTTATVLQTSMGQFGFAMALGLILILLVFLVNLPLLYMQRVRRNREKKR